MSKNYTQFLPVSDKVMVKDQFNELPLSIMEFDNSSKWKNAYFEQLPEEKRRSDDAKYLAGYGMSEFNSGLCEFILKYWSMKNSIVVDPFAGRATRAIISTKLGRKYYGYEVSPSTYSRSLEHYKKLNISPTLYLEDGCRMENIDNDFAHLVMTCPPYSSLEKYESVPNQLSDLSYEKFLERIYLCAENIKRVLVPGGFCCWVCANWREPSGFRQFTTDSINIFKSTGLISHDEVILKNNSPFAALQAYKCACKRITSKIHETLLVFKKSGHLDLNGLECDTLYESNEFFG
jgi:DNA modification methylase